MTTLSAIIAAVTAIILAIAGAWFGGKSRGKSDQKVVSEVNQATAAAKSEKAAADIRVESVKVANDVKDEVTRADSGAVRDRLRDDWTR